MPFRIEQSWKDVLGNEFEKDYMTELSNFLQNCLSERKNVYPQKSLIFNAFQHTPLPRVKIVILGQDPYHGKGQAHGLSFSVRKGVRIPPSLQNIFKELRSEYPGFELPAHGDLTSWADQGVLLLNSTLTVEEGKPGSHQNRGWERFTNRVIQIISEERQGVVFLLWGRHAQAKEGLIDISRHYVLKSAHPSPLSAHSGFFGCGHFKEANQILLRSGRAPINWQL